MTISFATPLDSDRRRFLCRAGSGFGTIALASLLERQGLLAQGQLPAPANAGTPRRTNPLEAAPGHFAARAKSVIWLFMNGGPSQVDTWDYKPALERHDGKDLEGFDRNTGFFTDSVGPVMKSPFKFERRGRSGAWVSEIFPRLGERVDDLAFIYSCYTDTNNHSPALFKINTGFSRMGFPSVGSWVTYGLGTESQSLPAFVVMYDTLGRGLPKGYSQNWGSGFLPGALQGTALSAQGAPIENLYPAPELAGGRQEAQLELLARLNRRHLAAHPGEADLSTRIQSFELAYRLQMAGPEALDVEREPEHVKRLYGLDQNRCKHFARQCIVARRLIERGVRFVQIYSGGTENEKSWDGHTNIAENHRGFAGETDTPIAGLLSDLKQRGLLETTLVVWNGEFGRLPIVQKGGTGRDHNPHAFTTWLAGGGVRGGAQHGATDELGHKAVTGRVSVHDLHATILHLIGLDHTRLTYRSSGRDFRLTDVEGEVVREILA